MKITNRSLVLWNIIIFSILSVGLFHVSGSDLHQISAFSLQYFFEAKAIYIFIGVLISFSFIFTYRLSVLSQSFYVATVFLISLLTINHLFENFSKLIIVLLFTYLIVAYYFYQFLKIEINQACYNANFSKRDLYPPLLLHIDCKIKISEDNIIMGQLTNWDEGGCFIKLEDELPSLKSINLEIAIGDELFKDVGSVVSWVKDKKSLGVKFKGFVRNKQNWNNFINYVNDMGYTPEIVK